MSAFADVAELSPLEIWDGVLGWAVEGERVTFGVVELDPGSVVPEHHHENEQVGILVRGALTFRVGDETRELGPGWTWRIPPRVPHSVETGPDGATAIEVFAPVRDDWSTLERRGPQPPRLPGG